MENEINACTDVASIERALREIERAEVEAFHAGTAEAPIFYRPATLAGAPDSLEAKAANSDGLMQFIASDESTDRMGDVIRASGWKLTDFRKNPVFLWAHQSSAPPIGAVRRVAVVGKALEADVEFADTPFAQEIKSLFDGHFLRAVSVGFRPLEVDIMTDDSGGFSGFEFKKQELLELSAVPVPANARALRKAYGPDFAMTVPDLTEIFREAHKAAVESVEARDLQAKMELDPNADSDEAPDETASAEREWREGIEQRVAALEEASSAALNGQDPDAEYDDSLDDTGDFPEDLANVIAELAGVTAGKE